MWLNCCQEEVEEDRGKEMLRFELIWMSLKEERGNGIHGHLNVKKEQTTP